MLGHIRRIAADLGVKESQVQSVVKLLFDEGCTIPFVARYRKERTGSLDEVALRNIRDRYHELEDLAATRQRMLKTIEEQGKLSPELRASFEAAETKQTLEDLYMPFKPKRRTRAQQAKERGLEALLDQILTERGTCADVRIPAAAFVTPADSKLDPSLQVATPDLALAGAMDILAERIADNPDIRRDVRTLSLELGVMESTRAEPPSPLPKDFAQTARKFENYFDYREPIAKIPPHRIMAIRRGEAERVLKTALTIDEPPVLRAIAAHVIGEASTTHSVMEWLRSAVEDAYRRLLGPSIETELRAQLRMRAEQEAIKVFSRNLEHLLMLPPIPQRIVLGIDPGFRTGCKIAVVDRTGHLLDVTTIHPDYKNPGAPANTQARDILTSLIAKHLVEYIAIGNGTGSREIAKFVAALLREGNLRCKRAIVNESGASVYSADDIAREELPDLEAALRGAVSIARRLQDPLAELVKIDPRSIGVGQYQHDLNAARLKHSLDDVVESCVNRVGVNLNTASHKLLGYVSGIGPATAKNIVTHRNTQGAFASRQDLMNIAGMGPKVYQQAAGFLRVPQGRHPLDNTGVHPERYEVVERMARDLQKNVGELIGQRALIATIPLERYVTADLGLPTLQDIIEELQKPGRDPREEGTHLEYSEDVAELEDLKVGMKLRGTITNVTNFGAFVDIGVHQDGLVHVSELADVFVRDPASHVTVGQVLEVRVLGVDLEKRQIKLSARAERPPTPAPSVLAPGPRPRPAGARPGPGQERHNPKAHAAPGGPPHGSRPQRPHKPRPDGPRYTVEDLLAKFNRT